MTIWFASGNAHKKQELEAILSGALGRVPCIRLPREAGIGFEPDESGRDFLENALIKARALYRLVSAPVIADDSGLCVDALGGRPGIYSARYRGSANPGNGDDQPLSAAERNALLLAELGDKPQRRARFVCAMVLLWSEDRFYAVQETLEGEIITEGRGSGGFGYDPLLYLPEKGLTVAELSAEDKNALSHRGKAGRMLAKFLADDSSHRGKAGRMPAKFLAGEL